MTWVIEDDKPQAGGGWVIEDSPPEKYGPPAPRPSVGEIAWENLKAAPGRMVERIAGDVTDVAHTLSTRPKMSTALPLALPGGGTVLTRLGAVAGGSVLDNPQATPTENLKVAAKGVFGDPKHPLSMILSPAVAETLLPVVGKGARSFRGARQKIAEGDAAAYGREMGRQSPPLAVGAKSAADLQGLAAGRGQELLGKAKAAANDEIGARAGLLEVPSVAPRRGVPGHRATTPAPPIDPETQAVMRPTTSSVPGHTYTEGMTFQQANDALSEIGARAFSKNPLDRTFNGVDQRKLYGQVYNEIKAGLDRSDPSGKLSAMFDKAQAEYKTGLAFLRPLQKKGAFRTGDALEFNTPAFQRMLADPKAEASLRNKLGDEGFEALRTAMLRGGKVGEVDQMAGKAPGLLSGRGSYGMWRVPAEIGRTIFPNASTKYAGRPPYSLPPELQAILDVGLQKMGGAALDARTR